MKFTEVSMFKVGDKVVIRKNKTIGQVNFNYMRIHTINHVVAIPFSQRINLDSFSENSYVSSDALIHATPEEIATGHRIDCKKPEGEVMKSEFEKLPIIQEIITDEYPGLMFDERFSKYLCPSDGNEEYLNGAWMVWQHQQSKINELQKIINASNKVLGSMRKELEHGHLSDDQYKTLSIYADDLEQALKGDE